MIKTANEWRQEPMFKHLRWTPETVCSVIQAIQLDAIKHGMTLAIDTMSEQDSTSQEAYKEYKRLKAAIETARDNLVDIPK